MLLDFVDTNARLLDRLLNENYISVSTVKSTSAIMLFQQLEQSKIIVRRRKGSGSQFKLEHLQALQNFIIRTYPEGLRRKVGDVRPSRVQGVMQVQDSKVCKSLDFVLVNLRGTATINYGDRTYHLEQITNRDISLSLKIDITRPCLLPRAPQIILTVENPTAFVALEQIVEQPWQLAVYTAGKMSNMLLQQLQLWYGQHHKLIHCGDYDYVGLLEFARILAICPSASLYKPANLFELLQQYGNDALLKKQVKQHKILIKKINKLPNSIGKQQLVTVYQMLQTTAKALEQEGLYRNSGLGENCSQQTCIVQ
jgi:hypothetical protein